MVNCMASKPKTTPKADYVRLLRQHPYLFGKAVGFTKLTPLHNEWLMDMINGRTDSTLQAHRGSYKTTCVSIALAVIMILYPNDKTCFIRKTESDTQEIIKQTATILRHEITSIIVRELYGIDLVVTSTNLKVDTNLSNDPRGTCQLIGRGVGGAITGQHYDRIFTDDIVTVVDRTSKVHRDSTKRFYMELQNIKNRGGRIYNTGTPWHKDDCFELMPNIRKYDYKTTGLLSDEEVRELKDRMLPSLFSANYELRHIASEDVIFANPVLGADPFLAEQGICHIDAAYGGEDYTAMTIANRKDGKVYMYGRIWHKSIEAVESECIALYNSFKCGKLYCETNGDKGFLAKELRKNGVRVITYSEGMNKFLKITSYLKFMWKDISFVMGTDEEYIDMICDYNENAEHDDAPDSAASIARLYTNRKESSYQPLWSK